MVHPNTMTHVNPVRGTNALTHAPLPGHRLVELDREEDLEEHVAGELHRVQQPPGEVILPLS